MSCYVKSMEHPEYPKSLPVVGVRAQRVPPHSTWPLCVCALIEYHDLAIHKYEESLGLPASVQPGA